MERELYQKHQFQMMTNTWNTQQTLVQTEDQIKTFGHVKSFVHSPGLFHFASCECYITRDYELGPVFCIRFSVQVSHSLFAE
jgi:hypothetical protein